MNYFNKKLNESLKSISFHRSIKLILQDVREGKGVHIENRIFTSPTLNTFISRVLRTFMLPSIKVIPSTSVKYNVGKCIVYALLVCTLCCELYRVIVRKLSVELLGGLILGIVDDQRSIIN